MSQSSTATEARAGTAHLAGKYLTFKLGVEEYGLEILKVQEIIKMMDITKVPRTPGFVRGVINLRGKVIPVVDLRLKFGMEPMPTTDKTCVIVVQRAGTDVLDLGGLASPTPAIADLVRAMLAATPPRLGEDGGNVGDESLLHQAMTQHHVAAALGRLQKFAVDQRRLNEGPLNLHGRRHQALDGVRHVVRLVDHVGR